MLLASAALCGNAQKDEAVLSAAANFNPTYYVELWNGTNQITGGNADTVGGSAEYRYCWSGRWCLGPRYEQNKTDGVLWAPNGQGGGTYYRWPLMRYEALALGTEKFPFGKWTPFVQEGAGFIVTNGYSNSGWSEDFALVSGLGTEYALGGHWAASAGELLLNTANGCYGDPATPGITYCAQRRSLVQEPGFGFSYRW